MGVDFSHCRASWAYSGFMRVRINLAKLIGMNLMEMRGFTDAPEDGFPFPHIDPIEILLDHSDCDGEISAEDCRKLAPRLRELTEIYPEGPRYEYDRHNLFLLAEGIELAGRKNEAFQFT